VLFSLGPEITTAQNPKSLKMPKSPEILKNAQNRGPEEGSRGIDGRHLSDINIFGHGTAGIAKVEARKVT
jgi:hypothetical protein